MAGPPVSSEMGSEKTFKDRSVGHGADSPSAHSLRHVLTVKTPLLPRRSGITMESAQKYGADVEKRALKVAELGEGGWQRSETESRSSEPVSSSRRRPLKWMAALLVFGVTALTVVQGGSVYRAAKDVVDRSMPRSDPLNARQSPNSGSTNSSLHYGFLAPLALKPLPLGSIKASGWLATEMQHHADGLAGHEMDFYPIVSDSTWLGGKTDYSPLNEGFPYWLNGLVPLAYGLGDQRLIGQVRTAVQKVFSQQDPKTGFLGPVTYGDSRDLWSRYPLMLGLKNLAEADTALTGQILDVMYKFLPHANDLLADGQLTANHEDWARSRYADMVLTLQWLFEHYPYHNGTDQRGLLWQMMGRLKDTGIDWAGYYTQGSYFFNDLDTVPEDTSDGSTYFPYLHGVNVGQGLKTMAVDYRFTNNASLLTTQKNAVDWTMKYHGAPSGSILGDEREVGLAPNRGSELCTAVETIFSLHTIYSITGDNSYADRAELAAFNALPTMLTGNHWAHQYIALPNQPWAAPLSGRQIFWNVGDFGTTFGTAPNYPCCTVNHPQGYPKFTAATFMAVGNDGLAHVLLAPSSATTTLGNGATVNVNAVTDYPFSDVLTYQITSDRPFTFYTRLPAWASSPSLTVNGNSIAATANSQSGLIPINISSGKSTVQFVLQSALRTVPRANDTVAVYRGALLYALDVGQVNTSTGGSSDISRNTPPTSDQSVINALRFYKNTSIALTDSRPADAKDYNISNTLPWNYAIDETTFKFFAYNGSQNGDSVGTPGTVLLNGESVSGDASKNSPMITNTVFDYHGPTQYLTAQACQINWSLLGGSPFRPPLKGNRACVSNPIQVIFRPYGSLKLHMAELPTVSLPSS